MRGGGRAGREHARAQRHAARVQPQHQPQLVLHERVAFAARRAARAPARLLRRHPGAERAAARAHSLLPLGAALRRQPAPDRDQPPRRTTFGS